MEQRLYYTDSYLREFDAAVTDRSADASTVYLDRTAFYPSSGGQPFDTGAISGIAVVDVVEQDDGRIAHHLAAPLPPLETVQAAIDWTRRFDHMQQHTGQHLLSAVFEELFHQRTVSFHLGSASSTIDIEGGPLAAAGIVQAELRANALIVENRPVVVRFEEADEAAGLRKASQRQGTLRVVSIQGLDRSACGGTHVRATGEIGALLIRKTEKIRQSLRVEFLCGGRAVRRARADFEALSKAAHLFSAPLDDAPAMIAAQLESARAAEKTLRRLQLEVAAFQGRELYHSTEPGPGGRRRAIRRLDSGNLEEIRALAQSFTSLPQAVFAAAVANPPSVLFATSADSDLDAGKLLKAALTDAGGRGGGTARIAQGSLPTADLLEPVLSRIAG